MSGDGCRGQNGRVRTCGHRSRRTCRPRCRRYRRGQRACRSGRPGCRRSARLRPCRSPAPPVTAIGTRSAAEPHRPRIIRRKVRDLVQLRRGLRLLPYDLVQVLDEEAVALVSQPPGRPVRQFPCRKRVSDRGAAIADQRASVVPAKAPFSRALIRSVSLASSSARRVAEMARSLCLGIRGVRGVRGQGVTLTPAAEGSPTTAWPPC